MIDADGSSPLFKQSIDLLEFNDIKRKTKGGNFPVKNPHKKKSNQILPPFSLRFVNFHPILYIILLFSPISTIHKNPDPPLAPSRSKFTSQFRSNHFIFFHHPSLLPLAQFFISIETRLILFIQLFYLTKKLSYTS